MLVHSEGPALSGPGLNWVVGALKLLDDGFGSECRKYGFGVFLCGGAIGLNMALRLKGGFVGGGDTGEVGNLPGAGLFVEALRVASLTDLDRGIDVNLDKAFGADHLFRRITVIPVGADKGGYYNQSGIIHQLGQPPLCMPVEAAFLHPKGTI